MTSFRLLLIALLAGLGLPPANAQISLRSALSDDREATAGTTYEGDVVIANSSAIPQQATVYLTDYGFHADGTNEYGAPGSSARSNAPWVQFAPSTLTLAPGSSGTVQYTITVPAASDTLAGSYWSLLMVESVPPDAPTSTLDEAAGEPQYGIRPVMRYGVQLATHVQGTGSAEVGFVGTELALADDGTHRLRVDIANTGTRMVRPEVWAEIFDAEGGSHGRHQAATNRMYPGTSVRQQIALGALPAGTYKALVVVDAGEDDVYGAEYVLNVE